MSLDVKKVYTGASYGKKEALPNTILFTLLMHPISNKQCGRRVRPTRYAPSLDPTLTFDRLTLKLVCKSHLRWETFLPNLGMLGLLVLENFIRYVHDGRTDRQTNGQTNRWMDKSNAYCPFPMVRGIIITAS